MAYASIANLLARYDRRDIVALVSDSEHAALALDLSTDPAITTALADASGDIEAALLRGGRYTTDDLDALTGNSASLLQRMTCDITMQYLMQRRPDRNPDRLEKQQDLSRAHLRRLAKGEDIFDIDAVVDAGQQDMAGADTSTFLRLNLIRDRTRHYFPNRNLPNNR